MTELKKLNVDRAEVAKFEALAQKRGRAKATKQFFEEPPTLEELEEQYAQVIMIESGGGFMAKKDVDFYHTGHLCNAVANADASRTKALLDVGLDGTTLDIKDGEPLFLKCVRNQLEVDAGKMKVPKFERSLQDAVMLVSGDFVKTAELLLPPPGPPASALLRFRRITSHSSVRMDSTVPATDAARIARCMPPSTTFLASRFSERVALPTALRMNDGGSGILRGWGLLAITLVASAVAVVRARRRKDVNIISLN